MILVTGAAGKTGLAVLAQLSKIDEPVRALVHKADYADSVRRAGAHDVTHGDMRDQEVMGAALEGVHAVYHIPPNVHPAELEIGRVIIEAAVQAGIGHFVYHSVLHPQVEAMPHHWQKMRVEEFLFTSGLEFTVLQPTAYVQNILGQWQSIYNQGYFRMPYPVETRVSLVDLEDVAEAALIVLTEDGHRGAIYELVGTSALSQQQIAEILSTTLGKQIRADTISIEDWEREARKSGLSDYAIDTLIKMFRYYADYGLAGNTSVLKWLIGRPPTAYERAIRRERKL